MSYTKQNWQTGDKITAEKLNHMEDGIEGLNGCDIMFHFTKDEVLDSAVGISPEELLGKEPFSINSMAVYDSTYRIFVREVSHIVTANQTYIRFCFDSSNSSPQMEVGLHDNGTWDSKSQSGTYTYANGMYTFTTSGENPK